MQENDEIQRTRKAKPAILFRQFICLYKIIDQRDFSVLIIRQNFSFQLCSITAFCKRRLPVQPFHF